MSEFQWMFELQIDGKGKSNRIFFDFSDQNRSISLHQRARFRFRLQGKGQIRIPRRGRLA